MGPRYLEAYAECYAFLFYYMNNEEPLDEFKQGNNIIEFIFIK